MLAEPEEQTASRPFSLPQAEDEDRPSLNGFNLACSRLAGFSFLAISIRWPTRRSLIGATPRTRPDRRFWFRFGICASSLTGAFAPAVEGSVPEHLAQRLPARCVAPLDSRSEFTAVLVAIIQHGVQTVQLRFDLSMLNVTLACCLSVTVRQYPFETSML